MPTMIHTGKEAYAGNGQFEFSGSKAGESIANVMVTLESYRQKLAMEREKEFLDLISVNTDNILLDVLQEKATNDINEYSEHASELWKNSNGVLSTENKQELMKLKRALQTKVTGYRALGDAFLMLKKEFETRPHLYDADETKEKFNKFLETPSAETLPVLIPAYKDFTVITAEYLNKTHPYGAYSFQTTSNGKRFYVRTRQGVEESNKEEILKEIYDTNEDVRRTAMKRSAKENEDAFEYYKKQVMHLLEPDYTYRPSPAGGGFGGGDRGSDVAYFQKDKELSLMRPVRVVMGDQVHFIHGMSIDGDKVNIIKLAPDVTNKFPVSFSTEDEAKTALFMNFAGKGYAVKEGDDGKFYLAKIEYVPMTSEDNQVTNVIKALSNKNNSNEIALREIKAFEDEYNKFKNTKKDASNTGGSNPEWTKDVKLK